MKNNDEKYNINEFNSYIFEEFNRDYLNYLNKSLQYYEKLYELENKKISFRFFKTSWERKQKKLKEISNNINKIKQKLVNFENDDDF